MAIMAALLSEARGVITPNLNGLSDAEYFWEPIDGCWGIRRRDDVRSPDCWGSGDWVVETCLTGDVTPPMTTIGWRLLHAYDCLNDFTSRAFGHGGKDWNSIPVPGAATEAVDLMMAALDRLAAELAGAEDEVLHGSDDADFGVPPWQLLGKALLEPIHHCAEIGVLRHSYQRL